MDQRSGAEERAPRAGAWVVIAEEPDQLCAEVVLEFLRASAIPARIAAGDTMSFLGPSMLVTRVLVPQELSEEARVALERRGEDGPLPHGVPVG